MNTSDQSYTNDDYYLRYDADEADIIEEKKKNSSWPLLVLVPLIAIAGISVFSAYQYSSSANGIRTGDTNTIIGIGGGPEMVSPLPRTEPQGQTGPVGPSGRINHIDQPTESSEDSFPRRSRYIP